MRGKLYAGYGLIGAGAAAAVADGVLWYLWQRDRGRERSATSVMVTPTVNGAQVWGTF